VKAVKNNKQGVNDFTSLNGNARYVRVYIAKGNEKYSSVRELEVYGSWIEVQSANAIVTSNETSEIASVELYPNPAKDVLHVKGIPDGSEVRMISASGTHVFTKVVTNESIDIGDLPRGLYIFDSGTGIRKKIFKD
jgi:hypothetical protein